MKSWFDILHLFVVLCIMATLCKFVSGYFLYPFREFLIVIKNLFKTKK